jgi:hypothetical protein
MSDFYDAFLEDVVDTFLNLEEFAQWREFVIKGPGGSTLMSNKLVIWNQETMKRRPIAIYGRLMVGDVLIYTFVRDWPRRPAAGQTLYSPRNEEWTVNFCDKVNGWPAVYQMILQRVLEPGMV